MSTPDPILPNQAAPVTLEQLRQALAFMTDQYDQLVDGTKNVFVWLWEAIQGDFNQERSTGQIVFDTAISMIPGVDQVCDVRDIIANCKLVHEDKSNTWAWVSLGLTLIGLFPTLGSLVKGVLKIFFLFVRRSGGNAVVKAVDEAMTWVITFLRKRDVQKYLKQLKWDHVFAELAKEVKQIRAKVNLSELFKAFDRGIALMNNLLGYVKHVPFIGKRAQATIDMVMAVRKSADQYMGKALKPLQDAMDKIIQRLELEDLVQRRGIVNVGNVHFRGNLPEARAITLMRNAEPPPPWLSKGKPTKNLPQDPGLESVQQKLEAGYAKGYPRLNDGQIASFTDAMRASTLKGPQRLYRVVSPSNTAASADWMTEEVWQKIMSSPDPKAAWRKYLGVWPDWNADGQFVVYDIKPGEELKVWRGPASAQMKPEAAQLPDRFLEGGYEQIKFDSALVLDAKGNAALDTGAGQLLRKPDTTAYYLKDPQTGRMTRIDLTYEQFKKLPEAEQAKYEFTREKINHDRISGPFDTGWGYTNFDPQLLDAKLGLPALPGQVSQLRK